MGDDPSVDLRDELLTLRQRLADLEGAYWLSRDATNAMRGKDGELEVALRRTREDLELTMLQLQHDLAHPSLARAVVGDLRRIGRLFRR